jgi:hypothetical protein
MGRLPMVMLRYCTAPHSGPIAQIRRASHTAASPSSYRAGPAPDLRSAPDATTRPGGTRDGGRQAPDAPGARLRRVPRPGGVALLVFRAAHIRIGRRQQQLVETTRRDALTGLLNHGAIVANLAVALEHARAGGTELAGP